MKKLLVVMLIFVVALAAIVNFTKLPAPFDANTNSARLAASGPYDVVKGKSVLIDTSRKTPSNGDYEGAESRELKVNVWSPKAPEATRGPLVVYSHGFMSDGNGGEYLGKHLASYGYTVAAATYPLTNYSAPGGANPKDVVNQPGDVSFIIDNLLTRNSDSSDTLYNKIDPARIAAVGMSMGGMTTEMVAYHPLKFDERIQAAISIAGPAYMFSRQFFEHRSLPFMMVASPQDALINYQENAANILEKVNGATLVSVNTGSHIGFSGGSKWLRWMSNPDSLGCDALLKEGAAANGEEDWYSQIGSEEIGVLPPVAPTMCTSNPLPDAMNPLRQLQLTTLAVSSFLNCQFESDEKTKLKNCKFLNTQFAEEIPEISVEF